MKVFDKKSYFLFTCAENGTSVHLCQAIAGAPQGLRKNSIMGFTRCEEKNGRALVNRPPVCEHRSSQTNFRHSPGYHRVYIELQS